MYKNYPCNPAMGMYPPYEYMDAQAPMMDYMQPMEYGMGHHSMPEAYMPQTGMECYPQAPVETYMPAAEMMPCCHPMPCQPMPCHPMHPDMTEQLCEAIYNKVCDIDEKIDAIYPRVMDMHEKIDEMHKHMHECMSECKKDYYCK